ncbi:MAG: SDR family oxidoreductase [Chloroflexi bacterium]|nr:MAG: SDR family oxidoreductase [Chloroflexota bacterium]
MLMYPCTFQKNVCLQQPSYGYIIATSLVCFNQPFYQHPRLGGLDKISLMGEKRDKGDYLALKDRIAIITGAGRGIGRATAQCFARQGARVVLFSRTRTDVLALFQQVKETYGRLDVLVNCAGIVAVRPFVQMDTTTWDHVLNINLRGTFLCCRESFRLMIPQHQGVIINLSSLSGVKGIEKFPGLSAYNVSKSGIAGLTEILAVEGKPHNIRVCAVSPGAVDTEMLRQAAPHLKAGMTPTELAEILLFLASDSGRMFSGSNIELFTNT